MLESLASLGGGGRGPTSDMSPVSTLISQPQLIKAVAAQPPPTLVIRRSSLD